MWLLIHSLFPSLPVIRYGPVTTFSPVGCEWTLRHWVCLLCAPSLIRTSGGPALTAWVRPRPQALNDSVEQSFQQSRLLGSRGSGKEQYTSVLFSFHWGKHLREDEEEGPDVARRAVRTWTDSCAVCERHQEALGSKSDIWEITQDEVSEPGSEPTSPSFFLDQCFFFSFFSFFGGRENT